MNFITVIGNGTNGKWQLLFVCCKLKTETANFRLFAANWNRNVSLFSLVNKRWIAIDNCCFSKRAYLCIQQTCLSMYTANAEYHSFHLQQGHAVTVTVTFLWSAEMNAYIYTLYAKLGIISQQSIPLQYCFLTAVSHTPRTQSEKLDLYTSLLSIVVLGLRDTLY